ncbi:MAG: hypothetical protein FRX49_11137 [Trebouxia sp. A1-2]|nr:MAG: hypothetical protein FRX49_11137 [Trebouxia sp. A1-2]
MAGLATSSTAMDIHEGGFAGATDPHEACEHPRAEGPTDAQQQLQHGLAALHWGPWAAAAARKGFQRALADVLRALLVQEWLLECRGASCGMLILTALSEPGSPSRAAFLSARASSVTIWKLTGQNCQKDDDEHIQKKDVGNGDSNGQPAPPVMGGL